MKCFFYLLQLSTKLEPKQHVQHRVHTLLPQRFGIGPEFETPDRTPFLNPNTPPTSSFTLTPSSLFPRLVYHQDFAPSCTHMPPPDSPVKSVYNPSIFCSHHRGGFTRGSLLVRRGGKLGGGGGEVCVGGGGGGCWLA